MLGLGVWPDFVALARLPAEQQRALLAATPRSPFVESFFQGAGRKIENAMNRLGHVAVVDDASWPMGAASTRRA